MSTAKAQRFLLDRLGAGSTVLLAVLLDLTPVPAWADGIDAAGRAVVLVGKQQLGESEATTQTVQTVLEILQAGEVPPGVLAVAYTPKASAFISEVVAGPAEEILADGPRGTGKTQAVGAALAILAELHVRAKFALPLQTLWLHDSLVNAALKTARSLEAPHWGGLWSIQDDRRMAILTIAGVKHVHADFVGCKDETSAERLRAEGHVMAAEELVPSLDDAGGIEERKYSLAMSSLRLPTKRRVAASTTNPGAPDTWPYKRFIEAGGQPGTKRCAIPAEDRLTTEERAAQARAFRDDPDLSARLVRGEWAELVMGEVVAVGFRPELHVARSRLSPVAGVPLLLGHDAGLTPTTILGQDVNGELRLLASLASERAGTRQHLENLVLPWLAIHAPWFRLSSSMLIHHYDGSMDTPDQSNLESSPINVLREVLGGSSYPGAITWPGRRDPLLALLARLNPSTGRARLQLDPEGCRLLISALCGRWIYPTVNGVISRELPLKNHPWSDLGDSLCYLVGGLGSVPTDDGKPVKVETAFDLDRIGRGVHVGQA